MKPKFSSNSSTKVKENKSFKEKKNLIIN